jgi:uncharacterized protein with HEPN domain
MPPEIKSWLYDILNAIVEIEGFIENNPADFAAFKNDIKTKRAIERNLEIIGEALNRILKKEPGISISHAANIVNTRNRIIHGYDMVSDETIWSIVIHYLPLLKTETQGLLSE